MKKTKMLLNINSRIFLTILRTFLLIIPIPIVLFIIFGIISMAILNLSEDQYKQKISNTVFAEIERDYTNLYQLLYDVKNEEALSDYSNTQTLDHWTKYQIKKMLTKEINNNGLIEEIFVYSSKFDDFISTSTGLSAEMYHRQNYSNGYDEWIDGLTGIKDDYHFYADGKKENPFVLAGNIDHYDGKETKVAIRLDRKHLLSQLEELHLITQKDCILLIDDKLIVSTLESSDDSELAARVLQCNEQGNNALNWNDKTYKLILYRYGKGLLFAVATASTWDNLLESVIFTFSMGMVAVVVLFMIIYALIGANKNYASIVNWFNIIREDSVSSDNVTYDMINEMTLKVVNDKNSYLQKAQKYESEVKHLYLEKIFLLNEDVHADANMFRIWEDNRKYFAVVLFSFNKDEANNSEEEKLKEEVLFSYVEAHFQNEQYQFYDIYQGKGVDYYYLINANAADETTFLRDIAAKCRKIITDIAQEEKLIWDYYVSDVYSDLLQINSGYLKLKEKKRINNILKKDMLAGCTIEKIEEVILERIEDANFSIGDLAEQLDVSTSYLSRFFKQQKGSGVLDYIHTKRIEAAKRILVMNGNITNQEVAEKVGFSNVATFVRVFKKVEGITPSKFREAWKINDHDEKEIMTYE